MFIRKIQVKNFTSLSRYQGQNRISVRWGGVGDKHYCIEKSHKSYQDFYEIVKITDRELMVINHDN